MALSTFIFLWNKQKKGCGKVCLFGPCLTFDLPPHSSKKIVFTKSSWPESLWPPLPLMVVRVDLGDHPAELAEHIGVLTCSAHVLSPASLPGLRTQGNQGLGDVINHQPQPRELGSYSRVLKGFHEQLLDWKIIALCQKIVLMRIYVK